MYVFELHIGTAFNDDIVLDASEAKVHISNILWVITKHAHVSRNQNVSTSQFYSINPRWIIRIRLSSLLTRFETGQPCTRNPKERDLDHIPLLSKSIEWVLDGRHSPRSPAPPSVP
jgi:hypothetical protein